MTEANGLVADYDAKYRTPIVLDEQDNDAWLNDARIVPLGSCGPAERMVVKALPQKADRQCL